jgi:hypothetical protein
MFPHAGFVNVLSQLGFNQNDGIINLMPITALHALARLISSDVVKVSGHTEQL